MLRFVFFSTVLLVFYACKPAPESKKEHTGLVHFPFHSILIQPLNDADTSSIAFIQKALADSFSVPVKVLPALTIPNSAWYAPRKRYWADSVLTWMKTFSGIGRSVVLGITGKDISTTTERQSNWGIMGLAYKPGNVCVVSDYRLQKHGITAEHIRVKLLKVALHELGHACGLPHCKQKNCLMTDAEGKENLDKQKQYCDSCRSLFFTS